MGTFVGGKSTTQKGDLYDEDMIDFAVCLSIIVVLRTFALLNQIQSAQQTDDNVKLCCEQGAQNVPW